MRSLKVTEVGAESTLVVVKILSRVGATELRGYAGGHKLTEWLSRWVYGCACCLS